MMDRRQPYTEIPYRPAESGEFVAPASAYTYPGSATIPAHRSHPIFRAVENDGVWSSADSTEHMRAMIEAEREQALAEARQRRAEAEALAAERREAESVQREEAAAEERIAAERDRTLASEERFNAEAERTSAAHARAEEQKAVPVAGPVWYKEAAMAKRILGIVFAVVVVVAFYYWWKQNKTSTDMANGEIYSNDLTPGSRTRSGDVTPAIAKPSSPSTTPPPVQTITNADGSSMVIPATDSQGANAPNGARFSGTGKYQVYRQGNLTWRVNTESGESCVLFATEEEWRKPIVFNHGCNAS